jgi:hypothetical protein
MTKQLILFISTAALILFIGGGLVLMYVGYSNEEIQLRNLITAQQESNTATFDNMWAVISGQAQVADRYKESFQSVYENIMSARYGESGRQGALLDFIQESNPQFDPALFTTLSQTIEAQRNTFLRNQQRLIDLSREHNNLLQQIPSSFFVGGRDPIEITVVTSQETRETFETGIETQRNIF